MRFGIKMKLSQEIKRWEKVILEWLHEVGEPSGYMLEMRERVSKLQRMDITSN